MQKQKVSDLINCRITQRNARRAIQNSQKICARMAAAVRGKRGIEREDARLEAWLAGFVSNIMERRQVRIRQPIVIHRSAPRRTRQGGSASRSSAASGDGNPDPEPEPERSLLQLFSFVSAAAILDCSPQTLRNKVCRGLIPAPIRTAVGPRFTQDQLSQITTPTKPIPIPADVRRKVGRPRLASAAGKGGAA